MFLLRHTVGNARQLAPCIRAMSSKGPLVDLTVDNDGVAIMTLQRPPVNSLNLDLLKEISTSLDEVAKNKSKGMILTSSSPTVFSAGLDIMEMYKPDMKRAEEFWTTLQDVWFKLFGSNYPTAAAINGHAPAGGCLLSMSCEYRAMVGGKYTIGLNETALGIVAPKWFMDTMCQTISVRQAEYALTTARMFSVDEALKPENYKVKDSETKSAVDTKFTIGLNETALGIYAPRWVIDTMSHVIPIRVAEYALTTARMFTVHEAFKVGLIDEIAADKSDAIAKCKGFLKKFERIPPLARAITKQKIRDAPIKNLQTNRQADVQEFLTFLKNPKIQQSLEMYIQALKQKAAK